MGDKNKINLAAATLTPSSPKICKTATATTNSTLYKKDEVPEYSFAVIAGIIL